MITFTRPEWLLLLLALPAFALVSLPVRGFLPTSRWWAALGLRCAAWTCLSIALAEPNFVRSHRETTVIYAVDRSRSIPNELKRQAEDFVSETAQKIRKGDRVGVVSFDGRARVDLVSTSSPPPAVALGPADEPDQTDIAGGLTLATAMFPPDTTRRIVLLTDGNETVGNLLQEVESAAAAGVAVDIVPLEYRSDNEIWIDRLIAPSRVRPGREVELRAVFRSRRPGSAKLSWYHNGVAIPTRRDTVELTGDSRADTAVISIPIEDPGTHVFDVHLTPIGTTGDMFAENNRGTAFTFVEGKDRVLVLDPVDSPDNRPVAEALDSEHLEVEHKTVDQVEIDLLSLEQYSAIAFGNISADQLNPAQQEALAGYVRDLGGGLVLTGGKSSFGAGGWAGSVIEAVSPVSFTLPPKQMPLPSALVIVLDRSGSMSSSVDRGPKTQQQIANEAATLALRSLMPIDYVGLVAFSGSPEWVVPLQRNTHPQALASNIRAIQPGGGTNIFPALETAVAALIEHAGQAAARHIILLSDGHSPEGDLNRLAAVIVNHGISLSTIGVGDAMNSPLLQRLAKLGRGRFYPVHNPRTLPQIFFRETGWYRERLLSQEQFTPKISDPSSPLLAGLHGIGLPPLGGHVRTQPKPDAIVAMEYEQNDRREPVLAHWHVGMGSAIAFTSGWWSDWGVSWVQWDGFGRFWKQAIEWVLSNRDAEGFEVTTRLKGNRGYVQVEALSGEMQFANALDIRGMVVTPSLKSTPILLRQTGAGRYAGEFPVSEPGNYLVGLKVHTPGPASGGARDNGVLQGGMLRAGLSVAYSPEYRTLNADVALLSTAVEQSGGRMRSLLDAEISDPFERDLRPVVSRRLAWQWAVAWIVLPLFLLDVAVRRLDSTLALSIYVELAAAAMLIGIFHAAGWGVWGYVSALILAEIIGWTIRWPILQTAVRQPVHSAAETAAARAEALRRLHRARRDTQTQFAETGQQRKTTRTATRRPERTRPTQLGPPAEGDAKDEEASSSTSSHAAKGNVTDRLQNAKRRVRRRWDEGG